MAQRLDVYRSLDSRHRTAQYVRAGIIASCLSEPTRNGVLVTELGNNGDVLNQIYTKGGSPYEALSSFMGVGFELSVQDIGAYRPSEVRARCTSCGNGRIVRDLDLKTANEIDEVPVVPLFSCRSCGKRFYSMSDSYLRRLIEGNLHMFDAADLKEKQNSSDAFIYTVKEYIVRVFAAKKIGRLAIEK